MYFALFAWSPELFEHAIWTCDNQQVVESIDSRTHFTRHVEIHFHFSLPGVENIDHSAPFWLLISH